jgi:hypothetical protein
MLTCQFRRIPKQENAEQKKNPGPFEKEERKKEVFLVRQLE